MKLSRDSLDWARKHLISKGDTDLFPIPFEIDVLRDSGIWNRMAQKLVDIDVEAYRWKNFRSLIIPKDELSFRRASQLDPMDSIILLAIIKTIGPSIEKHRPSPRHNVVFSYRFDPRADGQLYAKNDGWRSFWQQIDSIEEKYTHILVTDLVDFYNQIYHHNLENSFDTCKIPTEFKESVMNLCKHISFGVSRGIPVGPHASHLIAEMSMISVDDFLFGSGYKYIRYVDDIHIFCENRQKAEIALFDLARSLDIHQKILPSRHKTKILTREEYILEAKNKLRSVSASIEETEMLRIMNGISQDPYEQFDYSIISAKDKVAFSKENLEVVLDSYLSAESIDFIRLKWFLRRLAQFSIPNAIEPLIDRIHLMNAILGEVAIYLRNAQPNYTGDWKKIGDKIVNLINEPLIQKSEYLSIILLSLFSKITELNHASDILGKFDTANPSSKRKIILIADAANNIGWIRSIRDRYNQLDSWSRRSMVYASRRIPSDERNHWLKRLHFENEMDELIGEYVASL